MRRNKIIFAMIILYIIVILISGCNGGVGSTISSGKIMDDETKESAKSKEIAAGQVKESREKITFY